MTLGSSGLARSVADAHDIAKELTTAGVKLGTLHHAGEHTSAELAELVRRCPLDGVPDDRASHRPRPAPVDRLLAAGQWIHLTGSIRECFDGRDVRRSEVEAAFGP